jgi:hypothetical protein
VTTTDLETERQSLEQGTGGQWRYFAQRFDGSGNLGDFIEMDLPLQGVEINQVLSGHNSISATITPALARMKGSDGRPVFNEWGTCLWAEAPTGEVYGGILEVSDFDGPEWALDNTDITGVLIECPFDDAVGFTNVDPIDVFRWIWVWYQSRPGCNFGLTVDGTASPKRLGTELVEIVDFDPAGGDPAEDNEVPTAPSSYASNVEWIDKAVKKLSSKKYGFNKTVVRTALETWLDGTPVKDLPPNQQKIVKRAKKLLGNPPNEPDPEDPTPTVDNADIKHYQVDSYKLNWYTNHDLASDIDKLATETPFDWHLIHRWSDVDDEEADLQHHIRIGYPTLGRHITDLRFVLGENIHETPAIERDGEEFANDVIVIGNGEGSAAKHGRAYRPTPGRMRRTKVVVDQTLMTDAACTARAESEIAARTMLEDITELIITDHPNAPMGSVQLGDEFLLEGDTDWFDISAQVRCVGISIRPDEGNQMTLTVVRTDRMG